ncbi:MAG: cell division protein ZapA [Rhodospirillaceae bacterium]|nr:cell division protein ZapA [Rhodospirillaceae bacterium]
MGQVSITIRGRQYQIACDDGQEAHLARLGRYLDQQAGQLAGTVGNVSDALLMVMVGLVVADELSEATAKLQTLSATEAAARATSEAATATAIAALAERIEKVAATLEAT